MFDARYLKSKREISTEQVICPFKGCSTLVERQRNWFKRETRFYCPQHKIFLSPSTFEYEDETENLLWKDANDQMLLAAIKPGKRESRMGRENSEDALTWNVFRYLEQADLLEPLFAAITKRSLSFSELIYWSYSQRYGGTWPALNQARLEFGETVARGSEPDLICVTDGALFFIEAKFTAANKTKPGDPKDTKRYLTGGNHWYEQVFVSDYDTVALQAEKYELLRFWLLGSWIAAQMDRAFYLLNVVREEQEQAIEQTFSSYVQLTPERRFLRLSWEEIYRFIVHTAPESCQKTILTQYFTDKTMGYDRQGELQRAFCF